MRTTNTVATCVIPLSCTIIISICVFSHQQRQSSLFGARALDMAHRLLLPSSHPYYLDIPRHQAARHLHERSQRCVGLISIVSISIGISIVLV